MSLQQVQSFLCQSFEPEKRRVGIDLVQSPSWRLLSADVHDRLEAAARLSGLFSPANAPDLSMNSAGVTLHVVASNVPGTIQLSWSELWDILLPISLHILQLLAIKTFEQQQSALESSHDSKDVHHPVRVLIGLSGPGGSGKTTLCEVVLRLLALLRPNFHNKCCVVSQDAYHLRNSYLEKHNLRQLKGRPETFDLERFANDLQHLKTSGSQSVKLPVYDRMLHEAVDDRLEVSPECDIILVEGLFLNHFLQIRQCLDLSIHIRALKAIAREKIIARAVQTGRKTEDAAAHYERVDGPNFDLVEKCSDHADLILCMTERGLQHSQRSTKL